MNDITGEVNGFVEACKTNWWKYEDKMVWQTVLMNRGMGLGASQWQEVVALSMEEPAQSHVTVVSPRAWIKLMRKKIMVETMYGGYDSSINNRNLIALLSSILIGVWGLNDYNLFLSCDYNLSLEFCQSVYILNRGSWILITKLVDPRILFIFNISSEYILIYFPNVLQVGTITLLALTGLLVFTLFFLAATVNAIVISLLVSLAAAGGFLALFFTCVTFIYIGALSVAVFVISSTTISAIIAALIATGRDDLPFSPATPFFFFFLLLVITHAPTQGIFNSEPHLPPCY